MTVYVLRRVLIFLLTLFAASVLIFLVLAVLPGDPAQTTLGTDATAQAIEQLRQDLGLDRPIWVQYVEWAGGLLHGDFGVSSISRLPIGPQIVERLAVTVPLALLSSVIAVTLAVPLGIFAALGHRRPSGTAISGGAQVGIAIPEFWAGIILITVVSVRWGWLPAGSFTRWDKSPAEALQSLLLPAIALAAVQASILTRYIRSAILDVTQEDYIRTARAKGLSKGQALRQHGFRNAAIPVVTVFGLQLASLLVGAVVVENVFTLPGLGQGLRAGVEGRDVVLVQAIVMVITAVVLVMNLAVDILYHALDPRLRKASA